MLKKKQKKKRNSLFGPSLAWAGVHRALVEQKDDHTGALSFRLLSQTDVISFLGAHMDNPSLARIFSKPYAQRRHRLNRSVM
jgi:hypothetical protein